MTAPTNPFNGHANARDAAAAYVSIGWSPIPVPYRSKKVTLKDWPDLRITAADVDAYFPKKLMNVGVLTGDASSGLADVDKDCPEARRLAPYFLPDTPARFGRASAPLAHSLYNTDTERLSYDKIVDVDKTTLLELRPDSSHQTVFPPSCHPSGEVITWAPNADHPFEVEADELRTAFYHLALATVACRHWPAEGSRHDAANAWSGGLLRAGWSVDEVERFIRAVATVAGDDQVDGRVKVVEATDARLKKSDSDPKLKKPTGWTTLARIVGDDVVDLAYSILLKLGIDSPGPADADDGDAVLFDDAGAVVITADASADAADAADARIVDSASVILSGTNTETAKKPAAPAKKKPSTAKILITFGRDADLFHTPEGDTFATFDIDGRRETSLIRSQEGTAFTKWLKHRYYKHFRNTPNQQALTDALGALEAMAMFEGLERRVFTRVAEHEGKIYLDLADEAWRVVEIDRAGWRVTSDAPVRFRRRRGQLALPIPVHGGSLSDLRPLLNTPADGGFGDEAWILINASLVGAMKPTGPYTILIMQGEQGSGKSTTSKMLRGIIDPNLAALRASPRDERDFVVGASNSWIAAFDNFSSIPDWLSDAFCRLSTGGGFSTRSLYTDSDEALFDIQRPTLINGIDDLASRPDLVDRSLVVTLPPLQSVATEAGLWSAYYAARPGILGALLDATSAALRNADQVDAFNLPRMADFAMWIRGAEAEPADDADDESRVFAWRLGEFDNTYSDNRKAQVSTTLEGDIVAPAVLKMLDEKPDHDFEGTSTELLAMLPSYVDEKLVKTKFWPKSARVLSGKLRRVSAFLRTVGVDVVFYKKDDRQKTRMIHISRQDSGYKNDDSSVRNVRSVRISVRSATRPTEACPGCDTHGGWIQVDDDEWICAVCEREALEATS